MCTSKKKKYVHKQHLAWFVGYLALCRAQIEICSKSTFHLLRFSARTLKSL